MSFSPIVRTDKLRAAVLNQRLTELVAAAASALALVPILPWTAFDGLTASAAINNIPQSYRALLLRTQLGAAGVSSVPVTLNADGGANYHYNDVNALTTPSVQVGVTSFGIHCNSTGVYLGVTDTWIFNYTGTVKFILHGKFRVTSGTRRDLGGIYIGASPVTSLEITGGADFIDSSSYALYGLRG